MSMHLIDLFFEAVPMSDNARTMWTLGNQVDYAAQISKQNETNKI